MDATGLGLAERARSEIVARLSLPPWYPALVAVLLAQHVAISGSTETSWSTGSVVVLFVGAAGAWLAWRNRLGVSVWPVAGWRSVLALGAWSLSAFGCVLAAAATDAWPLVAVAVIVAATSSIALGRVWIVALRADLLSGTP